MNLFEFYCNGVTYEFRMSYKAKMEIEKLQDEQLEMFADDDILNATSHLGLAFNEETPKEDQVAMLKQFIPAMKKMKKLETVINQVDLMKLLLKCNPKFSSITDDEWENVVSSIEDDFGFEGLMEKAQEIYDKVFMYMEMFSPKTPKGTQDWVVKEQPEIKEEYKS